MKRNASLIAIIMIIALAVLTACGNQEETAKSKSEVTAQDVKKQTAAAMETAEKYTQEQKDAYMQKMDARLKKLDRDIAALGNKIQAGSDKMTAEARAKLEASLQTLKAQKKGVIKQYEKLKASGGQSWDELKVGMDEAMKKLEEAFNKAKAAFK
jgi:cytochrome c556